MGRRCGEGHPGQPAVRRWREEAKRIPPLPPTVADPFPGVQDDEVDVARCEMVPDREPRLSAADDDRLESFHPHRRTRLKARLSVPAAAEMASLTFHQPWRSRRSPSTRYCPWASSVTRGCIAI